MSKPRLFIDLDDVVVDLWGFISKYHELPPDTKPIDKHWQTVKDVPRLFRDHLRPVVGSYQFVRTIEELYGTTHTIGFLTSIPKPSGSMLTAADDKRAWVKFYLVDHIPVHTIIGGVNKCQYVNGPNDILVDDLHRNIEAWNKAGGLGVLHTDFDSTLFTLKNITNTA